MPISGTNVRRLPFLSVPTWDISDEEIEEWNQDKIRYGLIALAAERIRDGFYEGGQEIFPVERQSAYGDGGLRYFFRQTVHMLVERGMVREINGRWYAIAPGRMEPSIRRAVNVLLDRRADLPPSLAAELDAWKITLDALAATGRMPANEAGSTARTAVHSRRAAG